MTIMVYWQHTQFSLATLPDDQSKKSHSHHPILNPPFCHSWHSVEGDQRSIFHHSSSEYWTRELLSAAEIWKKVFNASLAPTRSHISQRKREGGREREREGGRERERGREGERERWVVSSVDRCDKPPTHTNITWVKNRERGAAQSCP